MRWLVFVAVSALLLLAGPAAAKGLSSILRRTQRHDGQGFSAKDLHDVHRLVSKYSAPMTVSNPTGYVTLSLYDEVGCNGDIAVTVSLPTGVCLSPTEVLQTPIPVLEDDAIFSQFTGSEQMTVMTQTLFGVTAYFVTVNIYGDNNCQHLNASYTAPFIPDDCVANGSILTLSYSASVPTPPGYGFVAE
jgi:hypothetical protein